MTIPGMNNGNETMTAKMFMDKQVKIIHSCIHKGGSIGTHLLKTSDDINYVISGKAITMCDGEKEILNSGTRHICKNGSNHSI